MRLLKLIVNSLFVLTYFIGVLTSCSDDDSASDADSDTDNDSDTDSDSDSSDDCSDNLMCKYSKP